MLLLNALTSVFFVGAYQLIIGNLLLGIIESILIQMVFKKQVSYPMIIAANYTSAFAGFIVSSLILDPTQLNLITSYENGAFPEAIVAYTGIEFIVTLMVEFPFYHFNIKNHDNSDVDLKSILKIIIIVNILSYIITLTSWLVLIRL